MPWPDLLARRRAAARIPDRDGLRGPATGVVVLPMHVTWHDLREFDLSDQASRLRLYTIVLSQGTQADIGRFVHAGLLEADWPQLSGLLAPATREACRRRLGLPAGDGVPAPATPA